ncbi:T9SS type A sorting domain-containing protein [Fibrivirga algicola]|uniref:T9SS type A sorting domain-containing protein n=1 Tax=Fibrivirga algicola TaxID=2950420 RepID=A0ABX0QBJ4_9BACT|nr:T9SS type A sorting domain-containing protein [Fibrivirga algicola]NID09729.1 T9SS type A sorting domain-containing protein [Fibrivirga algicola]
MLLRYRISLALFFLYYTSPIQAQEWHQAIQDPNAKYGQVRRAYDKEQRREQRRARWRVVGRSEPELDESSDNLYFRWEALMRLRGADHQPYQPAQVAQTYRQLQQSAVMARRAAYPAWKNIGPNVHTDKYNGLGRVDRIGFHPTNTNVFYVGSPTGGLWKTTDGAKTWSDISTDWPNLSVADLVVDPTNPNTLYVATGDRNSYTLPSVGILKSVDGGNTWTNLGLCNAQNRAYRLVMDPANSQRLLAACDDGLYVTTNGGQTWRLTDFPKQKTNSSYVAVTDHIWDLEFKPGDSKLVYATTPQRVMVSVDGGLTFTALNQALNDAFRNQETQRIELAVTPAAPNNLYLLIASRNRQYGGYYVSTDAGKTFEMPLPRSKQMMSQEKFVDSNGTYYTPTVESQMQQTDYCLDIAVSPTDANRVYLGPVSLMRTNLKADSVWADRALNNTVLAGEVQPHVDTHAIGFQPGTNALFIANDGGFYRLDKSGNRQYWKALSDNIAITQVYHLTRAAYNSSLLGVANQDNGFYRLVNGTWESIIVGDGMYTLFDPVDPNTVYCVQARCSAIERLTRQNIGAASLYTNVAPKTDESRNWDMPFLFDETKNRLYVGLQNIWYSDNRGDQWQKLTDFDLKKVPYGLQEVAVAPSDPNRIVISHYTELISVNTDGTIKNDLLCFLTLDGGKTWSPLGKNLKNFLFHPTDPNTAWASWGSKLYQTIDGGKTWKDVSGNLPNLVITRLTHQRNTQNGLYVGSVRGVFYKDDLMPEWELFSEGLPNVEITDLIIDYNQSKIRAATYGRSVWENDLIRPVPIPKLVSLTAEKTVCKSQPQTVQIKAENFPVGTLFRLQLSDSNGGFASPIELGTSKTTEFSYSIPASVVVGNGYKLRVIADNVPAASVLSEAITVTDRATGTLSATATSLSLLAGEPVTLRLTFTGLPNWTYELTDGTRGEATTTPHLVVVKPVASQQYALKSISNGCGAGTPQGSVAITVLTITATSEPADWVMVYPTPTTGRLVVKLNVPTARLAIRVLNVQGRLMLNHTSTASAVLDLGDLPDGQYVLQIEADERRTTRNVLKR